MGIFLVILLASRARALPLAALALVVAASSACTTTRALTPWLRLRSTAHFDKGFIAESGGSGPYTTGGLERDDGRGWARVSDVDDAGSGFGFASGTRAIVGNTLFFPDGHTLDVACAGDLRATPNDDALVCVDVKQPSAHVTSFDRDGRVLRTRTVAVPPEAVRSASAPLGDDVDLHFLGFHDGGGLAFSLLHVTPTQSFAAGSPISCAGLLLSDDVDAWTSGPVLRTSTDALWQCNFPRPWRELLRWPIRPGKIRQNAYGEPNP